MKVWILLLVCGLALATAARYEDEDDFDDLDELDPDTEPGSGLGDRLRARLERALGKIKARLVKNKDLAEEFGERLKEITKNVATIGKEVNRKTLEKIRIITRKIKDLTRDIIRRGGIGVQKRDVGQDLLRIAKEIKSIILTADGYHEFKSHILNLKSDHAVLQMLKSYIESANDSDLRELLSALLSGIPDSFKARYSTKLESLFRELAKIMKTTEGFDLVYDYFLNLRSDHPLVFRLRMIMQSVDKEMVREILGQLIDALEDHDA